MHDMQVSSEAQSLEAYSAFAEVWHCINVFGGKATPNEVHAMNHKCSEGFSC